MGSPPKPIPSWQFAVGSYLPPLLLLSTALVISSLSDTPFEQFSRDPLSFYGNLNPFLGVLSNLGVLCWAASATVCLLSWAALRRSPQTDSELLRFYALAGLLSGWLCLDDLFMLHENVLPRLLGIPEFVVHMCSASLLGGILVGSRRLIAQRNPLLLVIPLSLFACSVLVDSVLWLENRDLQFFLEDGPKLVGIFGWLGYFTRLSLEDLRPVP